MLDLVIKNGRIVDGTGAPAFAADLGVKDGKICQIGNVRDDAKTTVDASGKIVSPGFIDPHTHFDAQLLWDGLAKPCVAHGVTTIVPGNCSLSLAPLRAEHRMRLVGMFNQIEEMPLKAFESGVEWNWETFEEFVTRIKSGLGVNVAPLVGHSALRLWVMGEDSLERPADPQEIAEMQDALRECLRAGAIGMSSSYVDFDETLRPVPSRLSDTVELDALCEVLSEEDRIFQVVHEFYDTDITIARIDQLAELSLKHQITTTLSPLFVGNDDLLSVERIMNRIDEQVARGARVWPQVQTRPIDISFCFDVPSLLLIRLPTWYGTIRFGNHDEIVAAFSDADKRKELVAEAQSMNEIWDRLTLRQVNTDANQKYVGMSLPDIAKERGVGIVDAMIDLSLEEDLQAHFLAASMGHDNDEIVGGLLGNPNVHIGASDGGAHILSFATFGDTGYLFSRFVRQTGLLGLEEAVKKITLDTANIWGIENRGVLKKGYVADITIFDEETIDRGEEYYVQDVPGDGFRYMRDAIGIDTVIIGGEVAYTGEGGYTDACKGEILPGKVA